MTARWAADAFAGYDNASVDRIVRAAAQAAAAHAGRFVGPGVPHDQERANVAGAVPPVAPAPYHDGGVHLPRPVGVVLARPATVAALYRTVLAALVTRNALLVDVDGVRADALAVLAEAAVAAGAPQGVLQLGGEADADLVLEPPARPDNVPVFVVGTAAPSSIVDSACFDNSTVDGAPSVLITTSDPSLPGAHLLTDAQTDRLRAADPSSFTGRDAAWIASQVGIDVPPGTKVLLAPLDLVVPEEPLAGPKPFPVLGLVRVPDVAAGIRAARAAVRLGAGRRAVIHSGDPSAVHAYVAALPVARVSVNGNDDDVPAWVGTDPDPGRLVRWTVVATPTGWPWPAPGVAPSGPVPAYPRASNGS